MNTLFDMIRPHNRTLVDLLATNYTNAFKLKAKDVKLFVNTVSQSVYHQIKGLVANSKFTIKDTNFLYNQIIQQKDSDHYILNHYDIYWTEYDCQFLDKFYSLHKRVSNDFIRSFLAAVMIEIMVKQSVFGKFNISTEGYISEKENLSKDKFLSIVEDCKDKIKSGPETTVFYKDLKDFISTINAAGVVYYEVPIRNVFYDYHPVFDIFENYGKGHFKKDKLHISKEVERKAEHYVYKGDRFIKRWAPLLPLLLEIDFERLIFKTNHKMDIEKDWLKDKLSSYGPTTFVKDDYIVLRKTLITNG